MNLNRNLTIQNWGLLVLCLLARIEKDMKVFSIEPQI